MFVPVASAPAVIVSSLAQAQSVEAGPSTSSLTAPLSSASPSSSIELVVFRPPITLLDFIGAWDPLRALQDLAPYVLNHACAWEVSLAVLANVLSPLFTPSLLVNTKI